MHQRAGDGDALAHAARESANQRRAPFVEAHFVEQFFGAGGGLRNILESAEENEILFGGEFVVDHGGVGDVAGSIVCSAVGGGAGERKFPCGGADDAGGDTKKGGFAGAVASREDHAFAGGDFKGDAAKSKKASVTLIDVFEAQASWSG